MAGLCSPSERAVMATSQPTNSFDARDRKRVDLAEEDKGRDEDCGPAVADVVAPDRDRGCRIECRK